MGVSFTIKTKNLATGFLSKAMSRFLDKIKMRLVIITCFTDQNKAHKQKEKEKKSKEKDFRKTLKESICKFSF